MAMLDRWMIFVSGPRMIEDLKRWPAEELSPIDGLLEASRTTSSTVAWLSVLEKFIQLQHYVGPKLLKNQMHVKAVHANFTSRTIISQIPKMVEELELAIGDYFPDCNSGLYRF